MTVDQLRNWRPDALTGTAGALRRDATGLDVLAERLGTITGPQLQRTWEGHAATQATALGATRQTEIATYTAQVATASQLLNAAATQITQAQAQLRRAEATAADTRLTIAQDGTATPIPEPPIPGLVPAEALVNATRREEEARAVTLMTQSALATAEEADRDAARALGSLPEMTTLFTAAGAVAFPLLVGGPLRALLGAGLVRGVMLRDLPPAGATPTQVAAWWSGLTQEQRQLQIRANPDRIGALNGLPVTARDAANRIVLRREMGRAATEINDLQTQISRLETQVAGEYGGLSNTSHLGATPALTRLTDLRGRLAEATRRQETLESVNNELKVDPRRSLMLLDMTGEPRAAIGIGPVDTAEHVAVVVPGLEQDVREEMDAIVSNAQRLRVTANDLAPAGEQVATIAWLGYDTPSFIEVPSTARAETGAVHLGSALEGLEASREAARALPTGDATPEPLHLTVVGHSYGSLTSGLALQEANPVDDVAFIGSPGVGAEHVSDLQVPDGHVFVGEARQDFVADLAHFGVDPSNDEFGAHEFDTREGSPRSDPGVRLGEAIGHSQYFDERTSSVYNLAYITLGRGDLVSPGVSNGIGDRISGALDWINP